MNRRMIGSCGVLTVAVLLATSLASCAHESPQSRAEACAIAVPVTKKIDAGQENMVKEAVENPDLGIDGVEEILSPLRTEIETANAAITNTEVGDLFTKYSDGFKSLADLMSSQASNPDGEEEFDSYTAELVALGETVDSAKAELLSLCEG